MALHLIFASLDLYGVAVVLPGTHRYGVGVSADIDHDLAIAVSHAAGERERDKRSKPPRAYGSMKEWHGMRMDPDRRRPAVTGLRRGNAPTCLS